MRVDYTAAIAGMDKLIREMGEPLHGDVVKTGSRIIHRLRAEVKQLREANDGLSVALRNADPTAVEPDLKGYLDNALRLVTHHIGQVANKNFLASDSVVNQAHALKVLAEAVSILTRGFSPDVLDPTKEGEDEHGREG